MADRMSILLMTEDKKGKKYSGLELEILCQAGLRVCEDNINGVHNKQSALRVG